MFKKNMNKKSDRVILFDIDYTLFDTDNFKKSNLTSFKLYSDVKNVLEELSQKYLLGILSKGEKGFQLEKLEKTDILKFFDKDLIFIFEDKAVEFKNVMNKLKNNRVWFVEDKINMLEMAKKTDPDLRTIWFKNGPFIELIKSSFIPDKVIHSILDLQSLKQ
jgi:FMN phosphatase YigB (HAD superfamily)